MIGAAAHSVTGQCPEAACTASDPADTRQVDTVTLVGDRVVLRPPGDDDIDALEVIFSEPDVARWWPGYDGARLREELLHSDDEATTAYVVEVDGQVAGMIQSSEEPDPDYRRAGIDVALGSRWHGTGTAVDALRTLARHLIGQRGHHHLTIDPAAENIRAIRCYEKIGFRRVGVLRRNERSPDGGYRDTMLMDLVADELR